MNCMEILWSWLRKLWSWLFGIFKRDIDGSLSNNYVDTYQLIGIVDRPSSESMEDFKVYYIGTEQWKWLIMFKCPCGCGDIVNLSLLEKSKQFWRVEIMSDKYFSIYPSIDRTVGCRSHFFIKNNEVEWCTSSDLDYDI